MKIRRYMAKNTQEAILKVKMDLGNEALILNTRKVKKKGLAGLFAKPMVEVLAAIDEYNVIRTEGDAVKPAEKQANIIENAKKSTDEKDGKIVYLENRLSNLEKLIHKMYSKPDEKNMQTPIKEMPVAAPNREKPVAAPNGEKPVAAPNGEISAAALKVDKSQAAQSIVKMFYNNLIKNEVDEDTVKKIMDTAAARLSKGAGVNDIAAQLFSIISGMLGKPDTIKLGVSGRPTVIIFVGPTGVGKTTTLAKIAANYVLNQKKSVGLITADTYRIAAVEQLKTYGEILGIPVSVIYNPLEVREAIKNYSDKDIILIDTAGRSHKNKTQFDELKALVTASNADEVYLVLSATTSMRNCREILNSYKFLENYKLIFTKTDETPVLGIILNARYLTGKSLSYITNGQSVPDDIETANIEKITKNLIGSTG